MFNPEKAIIKWRRQLAASDALSFETLDELESHLREEMEQQQRAGLNDEDAFTAAVRKLGQASLLQSEFSKATVHDGRILFFRISCFGCFVFLMLFGGWAILSFEPIPLNRALGLSALSAVAFYVLCLPFFYSMPSKRALFQSAGKVIGILVPVWCLWTALSTSGIVSLPDSLPLQTVIWSLCAAYGMTALGALFNRGRESMSFGGMSEMTLEACQSVGAAREQAFTFNHGFVGTEHLLLGLLETGNQTVLDALNKFGIDAGIVRREIQTIVGQGSLDKEAQRTQPIPLTPRALSALQFASREAKALNHSIVAPEHILLGLLDEPDSVAGVVLRKLGANTNAIRDRICG